MKKSVLLVLLTFSLCIISCKNDTDKNASNDAKSSSERDTEQTESNTTEEFKEGQIDITINFPDNPLGTIISKIDPEKGDYKKQMEELGKKLSPKEMEKLNSMMSANPQQGLLIMFTPLIDNKIYVKDNIATAKCNGFTYHLENTIDGSTQIGTIFMQSQTRKESKVTFKYDKDYFGKTQIQKVIDAKQYDRKETDETQIIAGHKAKKTIYSAKAGDDIDYGIVKLDVWTSEEMPKTLNFLHPFYVDEDGGIMKITAYFENFRMEYILKKVTPRAVTADEMAIQTSQPIYDPKTEKEIQDLGMKLMGTLF